MCTFIQPWFLCVSVILYISSGLLYILYILVLRFISNFQTCTEVHSISFDGLLFVSFQFFSFIRNVNNNQHWCIFVFEFFFTLFINLILGTYLPNENLLVLQQRQFTYKSSFITKYTYLDDILTYLLVKMYFHSWVGLYCVENFNQDQLSTVFVFIKCFILTSILRNVDDNILETKLYALLRYLCLLIVGHK